jgi:hypothetical protein
VDAGIVDENFEAVVPARGFSHRFRDAVCISNVQHERLCASGTAERFYCCLSLFGFTCGEQHDEASSRKLSANLESDTAIGAGNQC